MKCRQCGSTKSKILEKRNDIYRRHECLTCGDRFNTVELYKEVLDELLLNQKEENNLPKTKGPAEFRDTEPGESLDDWDDGNYLPEV